MSEHDTASHFAAREVLSTFEKCAAGMVGADYATGFREAIDMVLDRLPQPAVDDHAATIAEINQGIEATWRAYQRLSDETVALSQRLTAAYAALLLLACRCPEGHCQRGTSDPSACPHRGAAEALATQD